MADLRISVAIAAYNGERYLGEQLASIAGQTELPDEIVLSDDGSTDDTPALVTRFAAGTSIPVRLIRQPRNLGILDNFYAAFSACRGDLLLYCDQDDVWRPEKLARQRRALEAGAALVLHPSTIVDADLHETGRVEPRNPATGTLADPWDAEAVHGFGHQMAFRRDVFELMEKLRPLVERLSSTGLSDNLDRYIPFCASLVGPIAIIPDPLILFRRHEAATTPAGLSSVRSGQSLRDRAVAVIARKRMVYAEAAQILTQAFDQKLLRRSSASAVLAATERKARLYDQLGRAASRGGRAARLFAVLGDTGRLLRPSGFSNDRRLHPMKLALAATIG